jgi:hypothetical protein
MNFLDLFESADSLGQVKRRTIRVVAVLLANSPRRTAMVVRPSKMALTGRANVQATQYSTPKKDGTPSRKILNAR